MVDTPTARFKARAYPVQGGDQVHIQDEFRRVGTNLDQANDALDQTSTAIDQNTTDITTLQGDVTTINGQITTINGQITTINGTLTAIQAGAWNVQWSGITPGATVYSAATINALWAAHPLLYFPQGTYIVNGTLTGPATTGAGIIGDGSSLTIIKGNFLTGDVIQSHDNVTGPMFVGLQITRTALATSGFGLNMNPTSTNDEALLSDIIVMNHGIGLNLGGTGYSKGHFLRSFSNRSVGVLLSGQWELLDVFSANNGSHGFLVQQTGLGASCGQWRGLATFQNAGIGFLVNGVATGTRIEAVRLSDSFFGNDAGGEIYLDSYGASMHTFTNVYCELNGTNTPGISVTSNNQDVTFTNCHAEGSGSGASGTGRALSWDGAGTLLVNGGSYITSGNATAIAVTRGKCSIIGAIARGLGTGQSVAIVSPATAGSIIGCNASPAVAASPTAGIMISGIAQFGNYT